MLPKNDIGVAQRFRLVEMETALTIRDAATVSGLSAETIRYYERVGVLPTVPRAVNGYRLYTAAYVETLRFARGLRELGIPLTSVASLVELAQGGTCSAMKDALSGTLADVLLLLAAQRRELAQTEAHLQALLTDLKNVSGDGRASAGQGRCSCVATVERELGGQAKSTGGQPR